MALARQMAERILAINYTDLPTEAVRWAKTGIVDTLAVTMAGAKESCTCIAASVPGISDSNGRAVIIGKGRRTSVLDAAFINGIASHALDYDDVNNQIGGHPSVPLVPALFAFGDMLSITGQSAISAYITGFEVETQIGLGVNYYHYSKGWHPTATLGIFGTVALGAKVLSLSVDQTAHALAIAASLASGLKANFGTMTKPLHVGQSVRNGVMAVLMAKEGFNSNQSALEHKQGFFEVFNGSDNYDSGRILSNWGTPWNVVDPGPSLKAYPCCGSTHGAIECALAIKAENQLNLAEIQSIEILTDPKRLPHTDNAEPKNDLGAKFSVQYVVARALSEGKVDLASFTNKAYDDLCIRELMAKVSIGVRPEMQNPENDTYAAEVKVRMKDGQRFSHRSDDIVLRGPGRPMDELQLFTKFSDCAGLILPNKAHRPLYEKLWNIEALSSISIITDEIGGFNSTE